MNTFIQVLFGLTEVLTVLQCSFMSTYANSQIYSSRNICLMASQFPHRSGPSYAPVFVPVYALGLTDRSQPIRSSACSADPADVELVSQQFTIQNIQFIFHVWELSIWKNDTSTVYRELHNYRVLQLIHTYLYGPFLIWSLSGASYFISFIDHTRIFTLVSFIKQKHQEFEAFCKYKKYA